MNIEDLEYINRKIENAKYMGYDRVVELLEQIKESLQENNKDLMICVLWELVNYITIY